MMQDALFAPFWLAAIVDSAEDAIISKNLDGIITSWNPSAERIFGYSAAEAVGKSIFIIIPADRLNEEKTIIGKVRRGEKLDHFETVRSKRDGSLIDISLTISPIKGADEQIIGASKIARDISQSKRAEVERERLLENEREMRHAAEAANRLKDEFLATVSHELRTPLNAILGWAQIGLQSDFDLENVRRILEKIERNAKAQNQLIEDLLDVSRIITGKLHLEMGWVNLPKMILAAVDTVKPAADAKNIRLQTDFDANADFLFGDFDRLQQIVWNLLSNAVKFTPNGGSVKVRLERINSNVEVTVSDTGKGIDTEFLPFVFDRFRQADQSIARVFGGLGLGLAIVRQLTELHGGSVAVASEGTNQGATFTLTLPLTLQKEGEPHQTNYTLIEDIGNSSGCNFDLSNTKILIVDDEPDSLELLEIILTDCGAQVTATESVVEALKRFKAESYDLIISDLGMPNEDGYSLIENIRNSSEAGNSKIPAIALTAYARAEDRIRTLRSGFQMHVPKPVDSSELLTVVANLLGRTDI